MWHPVEPILQRFERLKVLVLGDLMLDEYIWGTVHRISPEAPVPVVSVTSRTAVPGGATNVAVNVATLGAAVQVVGLIGVDAEGGCLRQLLAAREVDCTGVIPEQGRPTTTKLRVIADGQQVARIDREVTAPLPAAQATRVLDALQHALDGERPPDALILSDYAKGCLTPALLRDVIPLARGRGLFVAVDPKGRDFGKYRGANVLTPNRPETEIACGFPLDDEGDVQRAMDLLLEQTEADGLLVTLGKAGMALRTRAPACDPGDARPSAPTSYRIRAEAREVYDVTGAGDTVVSAFVLTWLASRSWELAARVANTAAGIVVGRLGAAAVERQDLIAHLRATRRKRRGMTLSGLSHRRYEAALPGPPSPKLAAMPPP